MAWVRFTIPRIRFYRYGSTEGRDWSTVTGLKVIYKAVAGATGAYGFDQFQVTAGADGKALLGDFRVLYRLAFTSGEHRELSLPSPVSPTTFFDTAALKLVIPRAVGIAMDTQTTEIWPYLWSERMGAYYRTVSPISLNRPKFTLCEFNNIPSGGIGADERRRALTFGFVVGRRYTPGDDPVTTFSVAGSTPTTGNQTPAITFSSKDATVTDMGGGIYRVTTGDTGNVYYSNAGVVSGSINSVEFSGTVRNNGFATTGYTRAITKIGSTIYYGALYQIDGDGNSTAIAHTWTTSPATGLAWSLTEFSSALFGYYLEAGSLTWLQSEATPTITVSVTTTLSSSSVGERNALTFIIQTSEPELLLRNERLRIGQEDPPDNIVGVTWAQHMERWLVLTATDLYFSAVTFASSFEPLQTLKIADDNNEEALWVTTFGGAVFVGTTKDIYEISGDGSDLPDGTINIQLRPLHLGSPPVDSTIAQEGNTLVYRAADGYRVLTGNSSALIRGDANLLFMGYTRHGVWPFPNDYGRHSATISDGTLSVLHVDPTSRNYTPAEFSKPDGQVTQQDRARALLFGIPLPGSSSTAIMRYGLRDQEWTRAVYPFRISALHTSFEDKLYAGTAEGKVYQLDTNTSDDGTAPQIVVWTRDDDDNLPLNRKVPFDLMIGMDTLGTSVTVYVYLDETLATSFSASTSGHQIYKRTISSLSVFRRIQIRISGSGGSSTSHFKLYDVNVAYRSLPQHRYYVDTGNIVTGREDLHWFREINILLRSPVDVSVSAYFDDTLNVTKTVTVTANVTKVYTIQLGRECKGRQPRLVITTSASASASEQGFEVFWVKWFLRPSGNENQKLFATWRPDNTPES